MSIPQKDKPLLTLKEKDRLKNRPIDPNIRKHNNIVVKRKMQYWLKEAKDISFALDHVNETKLDGTFPDEDIFALFNLIKKLLDKLNFGRVDGDPYHPFVIGHYRSEFYARRAKVSDLERNWQVDELAMFLNNCYHSDREKAEAAAYKNYYNKKMKEAFAKHRMVRLDHEPIIDPATAWTDHSQKGFY
jgi:hypothetical protein